MSETTEDTIEDTEVDETPEETEDTEPSAGEDALGDPGKRALDAMKEQRNAAKREAREAKAELAALKAAAELKDKPADEQALEQARQEARAEAAKAANRRIVKAELRAAAKGKLADPADALVFLNLDEFDVDDDGEIDSDAIESAIDDLIARKPHLAVPDTRRFGGSGDQGAKKSGGVKQLTREQVQSMTPEQIVAAQDAGQLDDLLGIKTK